MPETGVDALEAATAVLTALYAYRAELAKVRSAVPGIVSPTLNVGLIKGGINTNVVPDQVVFRIDRRMIPEEDTAQAEAELRERDRRPRRASVRRPRSRCIGCCWPRRSCRSPDTERLCRGNSAPRQGDARASTCR